MYEFLLATHVVAAVVWVGGALMMDVMGRRVLARGEGAEIYEHSKEITAIGMRLFPGASLILLVAGILLVGEAGYDFGEPPGQEAAGSGGGKGAR